MAAPRRRDRLSEFVRQEVARIILADLSDPRLAGVTVTRADVSDDVQNARIYVRVIGTEAQGRTALRALKGAAGKIRTKVGERLQTRYNPHLTFFIDEAVDHERRMNAIMDKVSEELKASAPKDDGEAEAAPGQDPDGEAE